MIPSRVVPTSGVIENTTTLSKKMKTEDPPKIEERSMDEFVKQTKRREYSST
jgi:hypothetical protein